MDRTYEQRNVFLGEKIKGQAPIAPNIIKFENLIHKKYVTPVKYKVFSMT